MTQAHKHIAILNIPAHGHVNPSLPMIRELVRRGFEVDYYLPEAFRDTVEYTGARLRPYESTFGATPVPKTMTDEDMLARLPLMLLQEAWSTLPTLLEQLRANPPEVLICDDMAWAGYFAAQLLDLPLVLLRTSYVTNAHFTLGREGKQIPDDHPQRQEFRLLAESLACTYGLKAFTPQDLFLTDPELNIVFITKSFHPAGDTFAANYVFVGPQIDERPTGETAGFELPTGSDPLVLVSLGTVFNDWPEFFQMIFAAFDSKPWRVICAAGDKVDRTKLGSVPSNVTLAKYVPQLEVLPKADVFVTHCGMNSTQEALYFGVPMVAVPQMMEQARSALRVEELGVGRAFLHRNDVNAESLAAAVEAVFDDPSVKINLSPLRFDAAHSGGFVLAANALEAFYQQKAGVPVGTAADSGAKSNDTRGSRGPKGASRQGPSSAELG